MTRIYDKGSPPLYAKRDHRAQGQVYVNHTFAMTHEGLHRKSNIAGELAHRDIEIERLTRQRDELLAALKEIRRKGFTTGYTKDALAGVASAAIAKVEADQ